jgi:outer membrane protein assembly factor BamD
MAEKELNIAKFYYSRKMYLAAANRGNYIVEHFQQTPAVIPALGLMVESYRTLEFNNLAEQTVSILALNYPDSDIYHQLARKKVTIQHIAENPL